MERQGIALLERLLREQGDNFWSDGSWGAYGEIDIKIAEDRDHFYYWDGSGMFVQRKNGLPENIFPYHYNCGTQAQVKRYPAPVRGHLMLVSGSVRKNKYTYLFYCRKCETGFPGGEILNIIIEPSLE